MTHPTMIEGPNAMQIGKVVSPALTRTLAEDGKLIGLQTERIFSMTAQLRSLADDLYGAIPETPGRDESPPPPGRLAAIRHCIEIHLVAVDALEEQIRRLCQD